LNKFNRVPRRNPSSFRQFCRTGAMRRPRKLSLNHKRSRRRLFRKRAENQGFRHESSRKLGWMVEGFARNPTGMRFGRYSWFLSSVLFEARDIGLGNRYTCLFLFLLFFLGSHRLLFSLIPLSACHRFPFVFPTAYRTESSFEKIPESFESIVRSLLLDFPSSLFRVQLRLQSSHLRLKEPLLHAIRYLLYMLFFSGVILLSLCSDIWGLACGYHPMR